MKKIFTCIVWLYIFSCFFAYVDYIVVGEKTVYANNTIDNTTCIEHMICGFDFKDKGQYENAIKEFTLAITKDSNYFLPYMGRGDIYVLQGKYGAAVDNYNKAIALAPYSNKPNLYSKRGMAFFQLRKYLSALRDYNESIMLDSEYAVVYLHRGNLYAFLGEKEKAISDCNKALQYDSSVNTYTSVALVYDILHDYQKSVEYYKIALEKAPQERKSQIEQWLNEALIECQAKEKLYKVHNESADEYWFVSSMYNQDGNYKKAYEYALKAIQLNENFGYAYISLGESLIGQHKYDDGLKILNKGLSLVKIDSERAALYRERGKGYFYKKNYSQAINDFNKSIMYDEFPGTYLLRGDAYRIIQEYNKAYADYQKVVELRNYSQWSYKAYYALEELAPYIASK